MSKITTILFDWGGVLIDDPAPGLVSVMSRNLGVSEDAFRAAQGRNVEPFTKGLCKEGEFWRAMCADLGVREPIMPSLWGHAFREVYRRKEPVWDLARSLRQKGYKVGLLSNTETCSIEHFYSTQPNIFDAVVASCHEGCRKPEMQIYQIAVERLASRQEQTLFIDDNPEYVAGARSAGLNSVQFTSLPELLTELRGFGVEWI